MRWYCWIVDVVLFGIVEGGRGVALESGGRGDRYRREVGVGWVFKKGGGWGKVKDPR